MKYKIFIDGREGTTGLGIYERFASRDDAEILEISPDKRKDPQERARLINASDFTFLCLPDAAAKESVSLCSNPAVRIIDASTAHRVNDAWAYGFPELSDDFRQKIASSSRVAVPGCYASGFNVLCKPLVDEGFISADYPVVCHAVSGYSGAGKKAIAQYESAVRPPELDSPRQYALAQNHKHLPEMQKISGLAFAPIFNPYICDYYAGMTVTIPIYTRLMKKKCEARDIYQAFCARYDGAAFVRVAPFCGDSEEPLFIAANALAGTNDMEIFIRGGGERVLLCARFDNLGKGASGAAVQCMNIMMGIDETTGLLRAAPR